MENGASVLNVAPASSTSVPTQTVGPRSRPQDRLNVEA